MHFQELEIRKLKDHIENEDFEHCQFCDEEVNEIELLDFNFEYCKFSHICMQNAKFEKITFKDVIFENCDFSNTEFIQSAFIRCEFHNCKLSGCNLSENRLYHTCFLETNATYLNLSLASVENVLFQETNLKNGYFQETKIKNLSFEKTNLKQTQFFKTSLKDVDLSTCQIEGIAISPEDIKGAIVDKLQAMDLMYLLGVKVKGENL